MPKETDKEFFKKALLIKKCIQKKEYEKAVMQSEVFKYTNNWWRGHENLVSQMNEHEKMILACLCLIKYQLQANELVEAIQTIEKYQDKLPKKIVYLLCELYLNTKQENKVATVVSNYAGQFDSNEAPEFYKQAILLQNQLLLIKVIAHLEQGNYLEAQKLCEKTNKDEELFLDQLLQLTILQEQGLKKQLKEKLLNLSMLYEKKGVVYTNEQLKIYKFLFKLGVDNNKYTKKILDCYYILQKQEKAIQWIFKVVSDYKVFTWLFQV